jgi:hypothetical protein
MDNLFLGLDPQERAQKLVEFVGSLPSSQD